MSLREQILSRRFKPELAPVSLHQWWPETEGKLYVRTLSEYEQLMLNNESEDRGLRLVIACLCDKDCNPFFLASDLPTLRMLDNLAPIGEVVTAFDRLVSQKKTPEPSPQ